MGNQVLWDMVSANISQANNVYLRLLLVTANSHISTLRVFVLMELGAE